MPPSKSSQSAKTPARKHATRQPARKGGRAALLIGAVVAVILAWGWTPLTAQAEAGTAYGARVACSCRYVGGRELGDCEKDFLDGMGMVSLSEDDVDRSVTASVPLIASTTATYREGWGCVLETYDD